MNSVLEEGYPVQLLSIDNNVFSINERALKIIRDIKKDHKIVAVSIAGVFRKGKSFLLGFFLRYLNFEYNKSEKSRSTWWGKEDDPLTGFQWRCGQERVTAGIQMWSEVFYATKSDGDNVAIIVLDTQGLFDNRTTFAANAKIFALSTLISSVQILNISQHIQEDHLQLLKFFTDYASLAQTACKTTKDKPFQDLLILVRDWFYPHETPYGRQGGQQLIEKVFAVKDDQDEELRSVRQHIRSCFEHINGFLMPYPGTKVATSPKFDGRLCEIEDEFKDSLKELIPSVLSRQNLISKKLNGLEVKSIEFLKYLEMYVDKLNESDTPTPKGIIAANAEASLQIALEAAINHYKESMDLFCASYVVDKILEKKNGECRYNTLLFFKDFPKFSVDHMWVSYDKRLREEMEKLYQKYLIDNEKKKEIHVLKTNKVEQDGKIARLNNQLENMKQSKEIQEEDTNRMKKELEKLKKSEVLYKEALENVKEDLNQVKTRENSLADKLRTLSLDQERSRRVDSFQLPMNFAPMGGPSWGGFVQPSPSFCSLGSHQSSSCSSRRSSSSSTSSYMCSVCGRSCASGAGLAAHMRAHSRRGEY